MTRLGIRARFALLTAVLVLVISALVGAGGYLTLRHALLSRAQREADGQARQLVALVDVGGEGGDRQQANQVDVTTPPLPAGSPGQACWSASCGPTARTALACRETATVRFGSVRVVTSGQQAPRMAADP